MLQCAICPASTTPHQLPSQAKTGNQGIALKLFLESRGTALSTAAPTFTPPQQLAYATSDALLGAFSCRSLSSVREVSSILRWLATHRLRS